MTLNEKQFRHTEMMALLILRANSLGYKCRLAD